MTKNRNNRVKYVKLVLESCYRITCNHHDVSRLSYCVTFEWEFTKTTVFHKVHLSHVTQLYVWCGDIFCSNKMSTSKRQVPLLPVSIVG